jgi:hypothetical protein
MSHGLLNRLVNYQNNGKNAFQHVGHSNLVMYITNGRRTEELNHQLFTCLLIVEVDFLVISRTG